MDADTHAQVAEDDDVNGIEDIIMIDDDDDDDEPLIRNRHYQDKSTKNKSKASKKTMIEDDDDNEEEDEPLIRTRHYQAEGVKNKDEASIETMVKDDDVEEDEPQTRTRSRHHQSVANVEKVTAPSKTSGEVLVDQLSVSKTPTRARSRRRLDKVPALAKHYVERLKDLRVSAEIYLDKGKGKASVLPSPSESPLGVIIPDWFL